MYKNIKKLVFNDRGNLPIILQDEISECGLACIVMISNYLGHDIDLNFLRQFEGTSIKGTSLLNLVNLCERLNLRTKVLRIELNELNKIQYPAILHWDLNHFVVLKKIKKNEIIIHDPALGIRKCSLSEVSERFTGIVLEIQCKDNFQVIRIKNKLSLFDLFKNVKGINRTICLLFLISLVVEVLGLTSPLFIQYVTDSGINGKELNNLFVLAFGFSLMTLFLMFSEYIRSQYVLYIKNNLNEQFSSNTILHLLKLPINYFEKRHKADIQSRFFSIDYIQNKLSTDFVNTMLEGMMLGLTLGLMFLYSRLLSIIVVSSILIFLLINYFSYNVLKKYMNESLRLHAQSSSYFLETLQGILAVKSFGKERNRFNLWHNSFISSLNADIKISQINIICSTLKKLLFNLEHIVVICVGASMILKNEFSIGMLVAYLAFRLHLVNKTTLFVQNLLDYKFISIHLSRLSDILFQEEEEINYSNVPRKDLKGKLFLSNLSFQYENDKKFIFHDLNLEIQAGEKIVITGVSGCGKTTLLKVMMGLLKPTQGEIFIDNISVQQFGLKDYRHITASVMQEDILLRGSILQNISFFDEKMDLEMIYQSARQAQIHEEISKLPMGYETLVGEMSALLSGGQKQRLLLARALYKKTKNIIFRRGYKPLGHRERKKDKSNIKNSLYNASGYCSS